MNGETMTLQDLQGERSPTYMRIAMVDEFKTNRLILFSLLSVEDALYFLTDLESPNESRL